MPDSTGQVEGATRLEYLIGRLKRAGREGLSHDFMAYLAEVIGEVFANEAVTKAVVAGTVTREAATHALIGILACDGGSGILNYGRWAWARMEAVKLVGADAIKRRQEDDLAESKANGGKVIDLTELTEDAVQEGGTDGS